MFDCYCDYETSTVWDERIVRARKKWRCGDCHGTIKPGETYRRVGSLFDHQWSTYRRCGDCAVIACDMTQLTKNKNGCWCNLWGGMMEQLVEIYHDASPVELKLIHPIFAAFNAASRERGGRSLPMELFTEDPDA